MRRKLVDDATALMLKIARDVSARQTIAMIRSELFRVYRLGYHTGWNARRRAPKVATMTTPELLPESVNETPDTPDRG